MHTSWIYRFIIITFLSTNLLHAQSLSPAKTSHGKKTSWKMNRTLGIAGAVCIGGIVFRKLYLAWDIIPDITKAMSEFEPSFEPNTCDSSSLELNAATKQDALEKAAKLDIALTAYMQNPNSSTKENFKEAFKQFMTFIALNKKHTAEILALPMPEYNCPVQEMINTAEEINANPQKCEQQWRQAKQADEMVQQFSKNFPEEEREKRRQAFITLEKEFKEKVDVYNKNNSNKNHEAKLVAFMTLQTAMVPLSLAEFSSDPIIHETQIEIMELMQKDPAFLQKIISQCPPPDQKWVLQLVREVEGLGSILGNFNL